MCTLIQYSKFINFKKIKVYKVKKRGIEKRQLDKHVILGHNETETGPLAE